MFDIPSCISHRFHITMLLPTYIRTLFSVPQFFIWIFEPGEVKNLTLGQIGTTRSFKHKKTLVQRNEHNRSF